MKLQLQINSKAISEPNRATEKHSVLITPPIDESFWLYRVPLSHTQAIVGFPKFNVIGIGFQREEDWNTNLPSGCDAEKIYEHISHNKKDAKVTKQQCLEAIRLIQAAVLQMQKTTAIEALRVASTETEKLQALSVFLRHSGSHEVAETFDRAL